MKIVFIANFTQLYHEEGRARSFEKIGCDVYRYNEKTIDNIKVQEIVDLKPDFVLFAKLKMDHQIRLHLLTSLKQNKIKTVCWIPDLYFGLSRGDFLKRGLKPTEDSVFSADYVLTPDGGHDKEWKELGINHHVLRQGILDEECRKGLPVVVPKIVFVGMQNPEYPYRSNLMSFIQAKYPYNFQWFGRYDTLEIRGNALNNIYTSAKIVIGDSVYSPYYWSNRIYETIGRGGFIIHPMIEGLEKEYIPYKHFIPYRHGDFKGLAEKIDYFLKNEKERKEIANAGFEYTKDNHTLVHRAKQLLEIIK